MLFRSPGTREDRGACLTFTGTALLKIILGEQRDFCLEFFEMQVSMISGGIADAIRIAGPTN